MKQIVKFPKDKQKEENISGVYRIDCNKVIKITLVKQLEVKTRFEKKISHIKYNRPDK